MDLFPLRRDNWFRKTTKISGLSYILWGQKKLLRYELVTIYGLLTEGLSKSTQLTIKTLYKNRIRENFTKFTLKEKIVQNFEVIDVFFFLSLFFRSFFPLLHPPCRLLPCRVPRNLLTFFGGFQKVTEIGRTH